MMVCEPTENQTNLDCAVFAAGLQPQNAERLRDDETLLAVVRGRNTLKDLETFECSRATGSFMGHHAADGSVEDLGRSTVMERTRFFGIDNVAFMQEVMITELGFTDENRQVK